MFAVFIQFGCLMHHPGDDFRFGEHGTDFPEQQIFQLCRRDSLQGADGVDAFHILFTGKVTVAFILFLGESFHHHPAAASAPDQSPERRKPDVFFAAETLSLIRSVITSRSY